MSLALWTFFAGLLLLVLFFYYIATVSERAKRIVGAILAVYVSAVAVWQAFPPFDKEVDGKIVEYGKITLGLDLKGGTAFLIKLMPADAKAPEVKPGEKPVESPVVEKRTVDKAALDQAVEVIRRRVDEMGTNEPVITPAGEDRILVQIPGLSTDRLDDVRSRLKQVAKLDFRMVHPQSEQLLPRVESQEEVLDPAYVVMEMKEHDGKQADRKLIVRKDADITGDHVTHAYANYDKEGWSIGIQFDKAGGDTFFELTRNMRRDQDRFAIVLDGKILSAPTNQVEGGIAGGSCRITGQFKEEEARGLASALLNPLQNPVSIESESTVSASLGEDAIDSGIRAGLLGILLTAFVCLVYYRLSGLFATIALVITVLVLFGAMGMLHIVLTLPGIAGIILTLGMAIDANVLIFERLREELAAGKTLKTAVDQAFDRAFTAIFDSNVTTLISAFILFLLATGPVKGFAVALTVGILGSLFTALIVSRTLYAWAIEKFGLEKISMGNIVKNTKINFMGFRKVALTFSFLIIAGSMAIFYARGEKNYSIDFKGGDRLVLEAQGQKPTDGEVRTVCEGLGVGEVVVQTSKSADGTKEYVEIRSNKETGEKIEAALLTKFPDAKFHVQQVEKVGALVGDELKRTSAIALGLGMLGIMLYVTLRFEFSFALGALVALVHDVVITIGAFALFQRELSLVTVGAILTIGGYSINDTIVVFDRIREAINSGRKGSTVSIMNACVNEMLGRTFLTGGITLVTTLGLFLFGGPVLHDFAFAILIGVIVGTYSSVFIAAPVVLWWSGRGGGDLRTEIKKNDEAAVVPA